MGSGSALKAVWRYGRWVLLALVLAIVGLTVARIPHVMQQQKSADAVAYIQSRHITMADVDGKHLPPPPDPTKADATIAGIDANGNGIRDDVELAIFKKYPNDTALRAAALQYAMVQQLYLTSVFNTQTWKVVAELDDRAYQCIGENVPRTNIAQHVQIVKSLSTEVEKLVFDTPARQAQRQKVSKFTTSFGDNAVNYCDVALNSS